MTSPMTDSSDDEPLDRFKEAADCDYINDFVLECPRPVIIKSIVSPKKKSEIKDKKKNTFEDFLARRLYHRLEQQIELVDGIIPTRKPPTVKKQNYGIFLLSCSSSVASAEPDITDHVPQKRPTTSARVDYQTLAKETAVTAEWVKSSENTSQWRDNKKRRVFNYVVIERYSDDRILCSPVKSS